MYTYVIFSKKSYFHDSVPLSKSAILTSTKLLVMICWYFSRTLGSVIKFLQNNHIHGSSPSFTVRTMSFHFKLNQILGHYYF